MKPRVYWWGAAMLLSTILFANSATGDEWDSPTPEVNSPIITTNPHSTTSTNAPGPYNSYMPEAEGEVIDTEFGADYEKGGFSWSLSAEIYHAEAICADIARLTHLRFSPVAYEEDEFAMSLFIGGAKVQYESGSKLDALTEDPWMIEAGLGARSYFNSPRNGFSPYLGFSLAYQLYGWDYRTPVLVDGELYDDNALSAVEGAVSIGITTMRYSHISLFGEVGVGGTVFICDTWQGFRNDLFDNFVFVFARAGVTFKF